MYSYIFIYYNYIYLSQSIYEQYEHQLAQKISEHYEKNAHPHVIPNSPNSPDIG